MLISFWMNSIIKVPAAIWLFKEFDSLSYVGYFIIQSCNQDFFFFGGGGHPMSLFCLMKFKRTNPKIEAEFPWQKQTTDIGAIIIYSTSNDIKWESCWNFLLMEMEGPYTRKKQIISSEWEPELVGFSWELPSEWGLYNSLPQSKKITSFITVR